MLLSIITVWGLQKVFTLPSPIAAPLLPSRKGLPTPLCTLVCPLALLKGQCGMRRASGSSPMLDPIPTAPWAPPKEPVLLPAPVLCLPTSAHTAMPRSLHPSHPHILQAAGFFVHLFLMLLFAALVALGVGCWMYAIHITDSENSSYEDYILPLQICGFSFHACSAKR